jgi:hypothetical protein
MTQFWLLCIKVPGEKLISMSYDMPKELVENNSVHTCSGSFLTPVRIEFAGFKHRFWI